MYVLILDVGPDPCPTLLCAQWCNPAENPEFWQILKTLATRYTMAIHQNPDFSVLEGRGPPETISIAKITYFILLLLSKHIPMLITTPKVAQNIFHKGTPL